MKEMPKLTNVMIGLYKHDLINILSDEEWTFLTGLILYANDKGMKNPIDLSVKQAMAAGGGNNRQSVNRRRQKLSKIKIDGKPVLKVTAGKPGQNVVATYEIDYDLICSYNGIWQGEKETASQKYDASRTPNGREADGSRDHPKSRSEGDKKNIPPTPQNDHTTDHDAMITALQKLVVEVFGDPPNNITSFPKDSACRSWLGDVQWDMERIRRAADRLDNPKLERQTPMAALNYLMTAVINGGGNGGVSGMSIGEMDRQKDAKKLAELRRELTDIEQREGDWSLHIDAIKAGITRLEGGR